MNISTSILIFNIKTFNIQTLNNFAVRTQKLDLRDLSLSKMLLI